MLESMIQNPRPTRAECSDVANAVYDGTDVVMLSGETANGPYFVQAVEVMARTCCEAESSRNYNLLYQSIQNSIEHSGMHTYPNGAKLSMGESVASSAVKTALDIRAKLIVVLSETGRMANYVSKFRPPVTVLMMTPNEKAARQASGLLAGMHTIAVDSLEKTDELLEELCTEFLAAGLLAEGEEFVVCGGRMAGMKERLQVMQVTAGKRYGHIKSGDTFFFDAKMMFSFVA
jgi:pyruvate kinase